SPEVVAKGVRRSLEKDPAAQDEEQDQDDRAGEDADALGQDRGRLLLAVETLLVLLGHDARRRRLDDHGWAPAVRRRGGARRSRVRHPCGCRRRARRWCIRALGRPPPIVVTRWHHCESTASNGGTLGDVTTPDDEREVDLAE